MSVVSTENFSEMDGTAHQSMSPEHDLLDRYERMIHMQVATVNDIDEKAVTTMRIVVLLLGILLTVVTFLFDGRFTRIPTSSFVPIILVTSGVVGLVSALGSCLFTSLSSRTLIGPKAALGEVLASNRVTLRDYQSHLLGGYAMAIATNRTVIRTNSRRLRNTFLMMLYGIVGVSTDLGLLIVNFSLTVDLAFSIAVLIPTAAFSSYLHQERYMVVPHEG